MRNSTIFETVRSGGRGHPIGSLLPPSRSSPGANGPQPPPPRQQSPESRPNGISALDGPYADVIHGIAEAVFRGCVVARGLVRSWTTEMQMQWRLPSKIGKATAIVMAVSGGAIAVTCLFVASAILFVLGIVLITALVAGAVRSSGQSA